MARLTGLVIAAALFIATPLAAQIAVSDPHTMWTAVPCATWTCALSAMADAAGDPYVLILPTKSSDHPWVILKRVPIGTTDGLTIDETFDIEVFGGIGEASARFSAIDRMKVPILVTTTDGGMIVVALRNAETKRRSVSPR